MHQHAGSAVGSCEDPAPPSPADGSHAGGGEMTSSANASCVNILAAALAAGGVLWGFY